jgi:tetratricopeptide (TPR) repeat protein
LKYKKPIFNRFKLENESSKTLEYYRTLIRDNPNNNILKVDYIAAVLSILNFNGYTYELEDEIIDIAKDLINNSRKFKYYGVLCMAIIEYSFSYPSEDTYRHAQEYIATHDKSRKLYPYMLYIIAEYYAMFYKEKVKHTLKEIIKLCPNTSWQYEWLGDIYIEEKKYQKAKSCYETALSNCMIIDEKEYKGYTFYALIIEYFTKTNRYSVSYNGLLQKYNKVTGSHRPRW